MVLLGSLDVDGPLVVRFLVGVNSSVVSSDGGLEDSLGDSPVSVGSLHEGFHLVGLYSPGVHLDHHTLVSSLSLLSENHVGVELAVSNLNLGSPVGNKSDGTGEFELSSALGLQGDGVETVISVHQFHGLVLLSNGDVSLTSGMVSLVFPEEGEFLGSSLLDLLFVSNGLHVNPDFGGMNGSLNSGDSGNLSSDEVHLGVGGEPGLVDHDLVSSSLSLDLDDEHLSGVLDSGLPLSVLSSGGSLSSQFGVVSIASLFDLDVSLTDSVSGSSHGDISGGMGDLGLLDFTELSGVFSSGFTSSDTSKVGISVGSLLSSDGKSDSGSSLGLSNSLVLNRELELEVSDVSKFAFILESEEGFVLKDSGLLEGFLSEHLEVSGVSHLVLSVSSLLSGSMEASNDSSTSSKFSFVSGDVSALVVSGGGVDILEFSSLGTDESSLVEAVSVHPVRSTDDSDTSGVSTSLAIGLSLTPVLVLKSLTVDPSVTLGGLAGTDPVSLDVRLDHLSDLVLFFFGEDRYELSTPFTADTSSVVPGLLLLENFEVSDHLVGNGL